MKFIDFCAGIGGFRSGLEQAGHECVGYVEIDKYARRSYEAMYDPAEEWSETDVRKIKKGSIPKADLWCFGFPCQDISVAGRQKGLSGERSGIFYSIIDLLKSQDPENRPDWLLVENVKNLLSVNGGRDFTEVCYQMAEAGYDLEFQVLNSKDFGVPQNRERVFFIGHTRGASSGFVLSESGSSGQACEFPKELKQVIPGDQGSRVYDSDGLSRTLASQCGGGGAKTGYYIVPKVKNYIADKHRSAVRDINGINGALTATDYKSPQKVAIPCLTPDRLVKRQNGRRFKEPGEPMFTLTAQDKHGVLIRGEDEFYIRKLTPRECFRLQGFSDDQFNKAESVNSNTQLYKQAGNAVTVNVARYIGERLPGGFKNE